MSDMPKTDAFKKEWPDHRRHNWPCSFESAAFAEIENLERQLAEASERLKKSQENAEYMAKRWGALQQQVDEENLRTASILREARDQRDRLAEALQGMLDLWQKVGGNWEDYAVEKSEAALAAVKGVPQ